MRFRSVWSMSSALHGTHLGDTNTLSIRSTLFFSLFFLSFSSLLYTPLDTNIMFQITNGRVTVFLGDYDGASSSGVG